VMPQPIFGQFSIRNIVLRLLFLLCFCLAISQSSRADSILVGLTGTTQGSGGFSIGSAPGGTIWQGFSFTLSQKYQNVSILPTFQLPEGPATITTWLTDSLGPLSTPSNVIGSATLNLTSSGTNVFLSGLTLDSGTYDIFFSQSRGNAFWGILSPPAMQLGAGVVLGDQLTCVKECVDRGFVPASSWVDTGSTPTSPVVISGTPVPEPSTLVLLLAGLLGTLVVITCHKKLFA
jgi:PEP-CTERM motif